MNFLVHLLGADTNSDSICVNTKSEKKFKHADSLANLKNIFFEASQLRAEPAEEVI